MGKVQGYFEDARTRARKRRSPWLLLVLGIAFAAMIAGCIGLTAALLGVHNLLHPDRLHTLRTAEWYVPLVVIATLFPTIPIGLAMGNAVAHMVPAARMAFEAKGGSRYKQAQRQMRLAFVVFALPSAVIGLLYIAFG